MKLGFSNGVPAIMLTNIIEYLTSLLPQRLLWFCVNCEKRSKSWAWNIHREALSMFGTCFSARETSDFRRYQVILKLVEQCWPRKKSESRIIIHRSSAEWRGKCLDGAIYHHIKAWPALRCRDTDLPISGYTSLPISRLPIFQIERLRRFPGYLDQRS